MNLDSYQLCDDWGWFIDIECNDDISLIQFKSGKKLKHHFNNLDVINEYEYYYNQKNCKDSKENDKIPNKHYDINLKSGEKNNILVTTLFTALLTYVVFFVL